jgi:hypothetical protein
MIAGCHRSCLPTPSNTHQWLNHLAHLPPLPSRPPSRQSTQIITPVKTHANYIRPNNDIQQSLVNASSAAASSDLEISSESHQPLARSQRPSKSTAAPSSSTQVEPEVTSHRNTTSRAKKRKRTTVEDLDPNVAVMDLTQDSDPNNEEAKKLEVWASKMSMTLPFILSRHFKGKMRHVVHFHQKLFLLLSHH